MQSPLTASLINAILFQLTWLAAVLGASNGERWWALPGIAGLVAWSAWRGRLSADLRLAVAFGACGWLLDNLWVHQGLLVYSAADGIVPVWIVFLWIAVAFTLNHSLEWLHRYPLNGAVLAALAAPLCYLSGEQLDAVSVPRPASLIWVSAAWAVLFYLTFRYMPSPTSASTRSASA